MTRTDLNVSFDANLESNYTLRFWCVNYDAESNYIKLWTKQEDLTTGNTKYENITFVQNGEPTASNYSTNVTCPKDHNIETPADSVTFYWYSQNQTGENFTNQTFEWVVENAKGHIFDPADPNNTNITSFEIAINKEGTYNKTLNISVEYQDNEAQAFCAYSDGHASGQLTYHTPPKPLPHLAITLNEIGATQTIYEVSCRGGGDLYADFHNKASADDTFEEITAKVGPEFELPTWSPEAPNTDERTYYYMDT